MTDKKYIVQYTNKFKKQYKKLLKNPNFNKSEFEKVLEYLENNEVLPEKYHNHLLNPKNRRCMGMPYSTRYTTRISKAKR